MEFDFSKPVPKLDDVPEQFRSLYVEKDGQHVVNDSFSGVTGAIVGLNKSLKAARGEAETYKKGQVDLTPLSEFGADPAAIRAAFDARVSELTSKGGDAAKAVERVRAEMTTANKTAMDAMTAKNTALQGQLYHHLVSSAATAAIAEAKGVPELLMPFVEKLVKVADNDGQFTVQVLDDKGEIRYSGVTGQPMTIKELVAEMKANSRYGRLFESEQQNGGGGFRPGAGKGAPPANGGTVKTANQKIAGGLAQMGRTGTR